MNEFWSQTGVQGTTDRVAPYTNWDASEGSFSQIPTSYEEFRYSGPAEIPWQVGYLQNHGSLEANFQVIQLETFIFTAVYTFIV